MQNLYRHFDSAGHLLYVGISLSAVSRLAQHQQTAAWFRDIANVTVEQYPSREMVLNAEREAIIAEHPRFNRKHNLAHVTESCQQDGSWITMSNHLADAAYKLTLAEKRLILLVLTKIDSHPDKPAVLADTRITVSAADVIEHIGIDKRKAYEMLTEASERIAERWIIIDRPDPEEPKLKKTRTRWVSAIDYIPDSGKVGLYLAPKIIPYLTRLAGEFVKYRIDQVAGMSSVYAIRLYEMLLQWITKGEREIELDWLREKFDLPESYKRICDLKMRVIDPAVEQVNTHSNINVTYTQRKSGRTVVAFIFRFGLKQDAKPVDAPVKRRGRPPNATVSPAAQPPAFVPTKPRPHTPEQRAKALEALAAAKQAIAVKSLL
jgi:Initiator Replication protein